MKPDANHLTLLVGTSDTAEGLRRFLVSNGTAHAGSTAQLRGMRRSLVSNPDKSLIVCVALNETTLKRHGESLKTLLADLRSFPAIAGSVGLLSNEGLTPHMAELGCDVYANSPMEAVRSMSLIRRKRCGTTPRESILSHLNTLRQTGTPPRQDRPVKKTSGNKRTSQTDRHAEIERFFLFRTERPAPGFDDSDAFV